MLLWSGRCRTRKVPAQRDYITFDANIRKLLITDITYKFELSANNTTSRDVTIELIESMNVNLLEALVASAPNATYQSAGTANVVGNDGFISQGFLAQGMARVTGKAAVCISSSGPGATNLVTAIADAKLDSIPIVCITGQVPSSMIGTDARFRKSTPRDLDPGHQAQLAGAECRRLAAYHPGCFPDCGIRSARPGLD